MPHEETIQVLQITNGKTRARLSPDEFWIHNPGGSIRFNGLAALFEYIAELDQIRTRLRELDQNP